jgi:hypothetical protein
MKDNNNNKPNSGLNNENTYPLPRILPIEDIAFPSIETNEDTNVDVNPNSSDSTDSDSDSSGFDDPESLLYEDPRNLPEDMLREHRKSVKDINRHPEKLGLDRPEEERSREE